MRLTVANKLGKIVNEIETNGCARITRLTVLKKWFEKPERLVAFAIWAAQQAASTQRSPSKTNRTQAELHKSARSLVKSLPLIAPKLDRVKAAELHQRLLESQNDCKRVPFASVRLIKNWDLLILEKALAICLWYSRSPALGYDLAVSFCRHYDSKYREELNGPSVERIRQIVKLVEKLTELESSSGRK